MSRLKTRRASSQYLAKLQSRETVYKPQIEDDVAVGLLFSHADRDRDNEKERGPAHVPSLPTRGAGHALLANGKRVQAQSVMFGVGGERSPIT